MESRRSNSGKAAADAMTPEQRQARARAGASRRAEIAAMPKAEYRGVIEIGETRIPCAVLNDGRRILTENGIIQALSDGGASGASKRMKKAADGLAHTPVFLAAERLKPFINSVLDVRPMQPIEYVENDKTVVGYDASILPTVCDIWLKAREAGVLQKQQLPKAQKAEVLMRGLAHIGIVALVDEATGYQDKREKDALAKILEAFVAKELRPWVSTFPNDYYKEIFRLYGLSYPPVGNKGWKPSFIGNLTNNVIYQRLAPDILPELKKSASKLARKTKLHQWLTDDVGHPKLREHLASVVTLLKLSKTPQDFREKVDLIHPAFGAARVLDFDGVDSQ